jgi:undecaprenyl-diphosphatase
VKSSLIARFHDLLRSAGWREFVLLLAVAAICGCILIFVGVTDMVREGELHEAEIRLMRDLRSAENPSRPIGPLWLEHWSRDITALGSGTVLTLVTFLVAGYLLIERGYASAVLLLVSVGGGTLLTHSLKGFFDRERPSVVPHLTDAFFKSYPSGHSMMSSVVYLTLAVLLSRALQRRRLKIYCVSAALFLSFLVGLSRVCLGVHYPTDVIAGWAGGTAWALLCWLTAYWLEKRGKVEPERE